MNKHTPGKWIRESGILVVTDYKTDCEGTIKKLTICRTDNPYMGEQEQGANARLIAESPMLLEALREIVQGKGEFSLDPLMHASNTIESMKAIARAAIEAAEGK
uniref:Uncharacterized protein n=1 Tax=viral metagenome TaxID=1070528 RepID=A0A6M3LQN8_9ZZZZ